VWQRSRRACLSASGDDEGFVYRAEWCTQWIVERPFSDTKGYLEYVRRLLDRLADFPENSMYTFFGQPDVWARGTEDPNDNYRRLPEKLENVVLVPSESPVGLDTVYHRPGIALFVYAYAEGPELVSVWRPNGPETGLGAHSWVRGCLRQGPG